MQSRHGGSETAGEFGVAIKLLDVLRQFLR
jgi:hypothetical protein